MSERGLQLVPRMEMTDVMAVPKRQEKTKVGDWVRVTRGLYTGDLAQVFNLHEGRGDGSFKFTKILTDRHMSCHISSSGNS